MSQKILSKASKQNDEHIPTFSFFDISKYGLLPSALARGT